MSKVKVLIVEDEPVIAEDIASILEKNDYQVTAIAYHTEDALEELKQFPDLVLLDINLNGEHAGIMIAETINKNYQLPFIFLTSYSDKHTLEKAKHTEPAGYIVKPFSEAALYSAIEIAIFNHTQRNKHKFPDLSLQILNKQVEIAITDREFELLNLIYNGRSNQQIADALFISLNTVKKHINNVYLKLGATSRTQAIHTLREYMVKG